MKLLKLKTAMGIVAKQEGVIAAPVAASASKLEGKKGFSLPSVIIGSIIAAILGGVAMSSMLGSVDKAAISAEVTSIGESKVSVTGLVEESNGFPSNLGTVKDDALSARTAQMPKELKYFMVMLDGDGNDATPNDRYLALKAVVDSTEGQDRLVNLVSALDQRYDGTSEGSETPNAGKFLYNVTCSAPTTIATSQTDCYYITPLTAKKNMPTDMAGDTLAGTAGATGFATDVTAVPDSSTAMN